MNWCGHPVGLCDAVRKLGPRRSEVRVAVQLAARTATAEAIEEARHDGVILAVGATSHQRRLPATIAQSGRLDMLMIRYNAAHRGAEGDGFPVTMPLWGCPS